MLYFILAVVCVIASVVVSEVSVRRHWSTAGSVAVAFIAATVVVAVLFLLGV